MARLMVRLRSPQEPRPTNITFLILAGCTLHLGTASIVGQTICCYSVILMKKKKTKLDKAVERTAEIIQAHLGTLPIAQAKAMRKELHRLAVTSSRSARREPVVQVPTWPYGSII